MRELGSVGSVCLRCQFRSFVASQVRARRGISSAASAAVAEEAASQPQLQNGDWPTTAPPVPSRAPDDPPSTVAARAPRHSGGPRRSASLAMFQSIVEKQTRLSSTPGAPAGGSASIELVKDVARIQTMMEKEGATLAEAYAFFEETVYPRMQEESAVPQIVKNQIAAVLLDRLALEKPRNFESSLLPSVTRITEIMIELDVLRPSAWADLVIELIQHIYRQKTVPEAYDTIKDFETAMARRAALLQDLLGTWRVFCEQRVTAETQPAPKPPTKASISNKRTQQNTLQKAFGAMFPQYLVPSLLRPTFAAFATYKLLTNPFNRSSVKEEAAPFLQMMKGLIPQARPPSRDDFKPIFDVFPDLPQLVWPQKLPKDKAASFLNSDSVFGGENPKVNVHKLVSGAISSKNLGALNRAWAHFWGEAETPDDAHKRKLVASSDMFDFFIFAFSVMRRPQQAIEVWNNMERIGIKATIKTWNSMLTGCVKANNARGFQVVWDRLIKSGMQLDKTIWTSRIHGYFACGDPDGGLRALDEMARIWALRGEPQYAHIAIQPTIEPVNAALAGLLRLNRRKDATKLLAWASKKGIQPDLYTFNTLLGPLVRVGDMDGIEEIFDTMRSINVRADVATFTILLEGTLYQIGDLPPSEQIARVERILTAMKSSGVQINMQTYAKIFHLLLREGDRAEEPVKAVLAHIWNQGLELTSHIYTMLADHYFSRDPPDCGAVSELIKNHKLHDNRSIDRVFWERVVSGYAQAGEHARALEIFDKVFVDVQGTTITFSTLYDLLKPLVLAGDGPNAVRVVEAARKIGTAEGAVAGGDGKRYWKHRFWHLAYEHGLMAPTLAERFRFANGGEYLLARGL